MRAVSKYRLRYSSNDEEDTDRTSGQPWSGIGVVRTKRYCSEQCEHESEADDDHRNASQASATTSPTVATPPAPIRM